MSEVKALDFDEIPRKFNPRFAILMAECSEIAFETVPVATRRFHGLGFERVRFINDEATSTECYFISCLNYSVIAFRGSQQRADWLKTNRKVKLSKGHPLGRSHQGFTRSAASVVMNLHYQINRTGYLDDVAVTGHSLGGALALSLTGWHSSIISACYAFGAPRVYGRSASKRFREKFVSMNTHRIVVLGDLVTRVPFAWWGFRHVGTPHYFDNDGNYMINPSKARRNLEIFEDLWTEFRRGELFDFEDHQLRRIYMFNLRRLVGVV